MARSNDENGDRGAFKRAFGEVTPVKGRSPDRVTRAPEPRAAERSRAGAVAPGPVQSLRVEREANGIVLGKRDGAHASILDRLEDPRVDVEAELDLHGLTAHEAEREVLRFVRSSQRRGNRWVRVIVGKGLHSRDGKPTLKDHIVNALSERAPARFVLAFHTAPGRLGGTGALIVRLVDRL